MIHPEKDRSNLDRVALPKEPAVTPQSQDHLDWANASISRLGSVSTDIAATTWAAIKRPYSARVEHSIHSWRDLFDIRESLYRITPGYAVIGAATGYTLATAATIGTLGSMLQGDIKGTAALLLFTAISGAFGYGNWKLTKLCLKKHDELKAMSLNASQHS